MIVSLTGFMGCGKSSTGEVLARKLGWEFIDLDSYISHKAGKNIEDIFSYGEEFFRAMEIEAVTDVISMCRLTGGNLVLALGGGTLTLEPARVQLLEQSTAVYLETSLPSLTERLQEGEKKRPLCKPDTIEELLKERENLYRLAPHTVSTDGKDVEEVASEIIGRLCLN